MAWFAARRGASVGETGHRGTVGAMRPVVSPLLGPLASDEFSPLPRRAIDRYAIDRAGAKIADAADRLRMTADQHASDRRGTAATLRAIDEAHGGGFFD